MTSFANNSVEQQSNHNESSILKDFMLGDVVVQAF